MAFYFVKSHGSVVFYKAMRECGVGEKRFFRWSSSPTVFYGHKTIQGVIDHYPSTQQLIHPQEAGFARGRSSQ